MSDLLSVQELQALLNHPDLIILDTTIDKVNKKIDNNNIKLIPNSLFFDIENDYSDHSTKLPHTMVSSETFSSKTQELGINND